MLEHTVKDGPEDASLLVDDVDVIREAKKLERLVEDRVTDVIV